ncbi:ficolin-3-like [Haliotis asinina]|uniref:ficolin-3-like n=1 Tax=Haliotis asinina TaxID=109174 RepID=UPI0035327778
MRLSGSRATEGRRPSNKGTGSSLMCDADFFNRSWSEYESGFGEHDSCFWLGNNKIRALTNQTDYNLQTTLNMFKIDTAENQYKIHFAFEGTNGVSNSDGLLVKESSSFYTYDESHGTNNTCSIVGGGWWYGGDCDCGNLNHLWNPRWLNEQGNLTFYNGSTMAIIPTSPSAFQSNDVRNG